MLWFLQCPKELTNNKGRSKTGEETQSGESIYNSQRVKHARMDWVNARNHRAQEYKTWQ